MNNYYNFDEDSEVGVLYFFENKKVERGILYCSEKCQSQIEGKFDDGASFMKKITVNNNTFLMESVDLSDFIHFIHSPVVNINSKLFHCLHGSDVFSSELECASEDDKPYYEMLMRITKKQKNI